MTSGLGVHLMGLRVNGGWGLRALAFGLVPSKQLIFGVVVRRTNKRSFCKKYVVWRCRYGSRFTVRVLNPKPWPRG